MSDAEYLDKVKAQEKASLILGDAKNLLTIKTPEQVSAEIGLARQTGLPQGVVESLNASGLGSLAKLPSPKKMQADASEDPRFIDAIDAIDAMREAPDRYDDIKTIWNLASRVKQTYDDTIGAGLEEKSVGDEMSRIALQINEARLRGEEPDQDLLDRALEVRKRSETLGSADFTDVAQWPRITTTGLAQSADMWLIDKETVDNFVRWYFNTGSEKSAAIGEFLASSDLANKVATMGQVAITGLSPATGKAIGRANTFYEAFKLEKGSMVFALMDARGDDGEPIDPELIDTFSNVYGTLAAMTELASTFFEYPIVRRGAIAGFKAARGLIFKKTVEAINRPTVRKSLLGITKDISVGAFQEGAEEGLQFLEQAFASEWAKIASKNFAGSQSFEDALDNVFSDESIAELIQAMGQGAVGGGGMSSIFAVPQGAEAILNSRQHEMREEAFKALADGITSSDLTGRSGEMVAALVTEAGYQTKVDKVYIDADKLEETLSQNKLSPDDVSEGLGAEIARARNEFRPVEMDAGTFAVRLAGSTLFSEIRDHIKFAKDGQSRDERKQSMKQMEALAKETIDELDKVDQKTFEESSARLRQEFARQIYETKRYTKSEAALNAAIFEGIYRNIAAAMTRSQDRVVTPEEVFRDREKLRIVGPGVNVELTGQPAEALSQTSVVRVRNAETGDVQEFEGQTEEEAMTKVREAGIDESQPIFEIERGLVRDEQGNAVQPVDAELAQEEEFVRPEPDPPAGVQPDELLDAEGKAQIFASPPGSEDRVRRKVNRPRPDRKYRSGKGEPGNARTRLTLADGTVVSVGKIRPQDWVERIKSIGLTDQEIRDFRNWYREVNGIFLEIFGQDAPIFAASWLMAQQNTSPIDALRNALRVREQILAGTLEAPGMKKGGVAHDRLVAFWKEALASKQTRRLSALAGAQKLYDFVDSALLKKRRTWMGNRAEGQQPAVIDVHTARDAGFLDETFRDRLIELGASSKKLSNLTIDMKGAPTEAQYERSAEWLHEVFDYLNDTNEFGGNFEYVAEVQALGWMALLVQTKQPASAARDAISARMFRMSAEAVFGEGAPLAEKYPELAGDTSIPAEERIDITAAAVQAAFMQAAAILGDPPVVSMATGLGAWNAFTNASTQIEILASEETAADIASAVGYLLQQTEVWSGREMRATPSGKMPSGVTDWFIDIDAPELSDRSNMMTLWRSVLSESGMQLGFSPTATGMRIYLSHRDENGKVLKWGTSSVEKAEKALRSALIDPILRAAESVPFKVGVTARLGAVIKARNDWKESSDGQGYLSRFGDRPGLADKLRAARGAVEDSIARELGRTTRIESFDQPVLAGGDRAAGERASEGSADLGRLGLLGDDGQPISLADLHKGTKNSESAQRAVYRAVGMEVDAGANTSGELKIYPLADAFGDTLEEVEAKLGEWLSRTGWSYRVFGPKNGDRPAIYPDFSDPATPTYDQKVVWIFDPGLDEGSFRDHAYTLAWRVTHEVAHGIVNDRLTEKYGGRGRRAGAMGVEIKGPYFKGGAPLTLADAMRAVEWEAETFVEQRRILSEEFGIEITDEQFNRENAVNTADAVYRSITGQFGNPGEIGVHPTNIEPGALLEKSFEILREISREINGDVREVLMSREGETKKGEYIRTASQSLIRMTEAADLSTLLHEGAHLYLSTLGRMVRDGTADDLVRAEVETILRYLEVDSIDQLTLPYADGRQWNGQVDIPHEVFARSFEAYLAEGRAPSEGMRKAFRKFQAWMVSVYGSLKEIAARLGVKLNPEIRGVFDRMIALDDVLAREDAGPVFKSREESGMTESQWATFLESFEEIREEAREKVIAPIVRRVTAEMKRKRRALFDELYDTYAQQVDDEPVWRAIRFLRDGDETGEIPLQGRLNRDQVVGIYARPERAAEVLSKVPRGTVARGGELDLQLAAEFFGFKTGSALLDAMAKAGDREAEIRRRVNEDVAGRPEFRPEAIETSAGDLIGGEALAKRIALELKSLRELSKKTLLPASRRAVAEVGAGPASASQARLDAARTAVEALQERRDGEIVEDGARASEEEIARAQIELVAAEAAMRAETEARQAQAAGRRRAAEIESAIDQQAIRDRAADLVANRPSGGLRSDRKIWAKNLQKAQREARKALAGRDYLSAVRAMERAALLNWAIVEADEALSRQKKTLEFARSFGKTKVRDKLRTGGGATELELIDVLLEKYDLSSNVPIDPELKGSERAREIARRRAKGREERAQRTAKWRDGYPSFAAWSAQKKSELEVVDVDESLFTRPDRIHWKELTVSELDGLEASLRNMEKLARNEVAEAKNRLKQKYTDAADSIVAAMLRRNLNRTARDRDEDDTFRGAARAKIDLIDAVHIRMPRLFRWMAGEERSENPLIELVLDRWDSATDRENEMLSQYAVQYQVLIEQLYKNGKDYRTKIEIPHLPGTSRTRGHLIAFALNLGTGSNLRKLQKGFGLSDGQLDEIMGMLDDTEWQFVQSVWDMIGSLYDEMADNHYRMTGKRVEKLQHREFIAPTGRVMKGGYYPMAYDPNKSGIIDRIKDRQFIQSMFEHYASAPTTSHNFTERRNENFAAPLLLDLDVIHSHIADVVHDVVWRETLRDSWKIFHQPQLKGAILEMYGKEYFDALEHRIRMLAGATPEPIMNLRLMQGMIQRVMSAQTAYALAGAFSTTFAQFTSITNSIPRISPENYTEGAGRLLQALYRVTFRFGETREFIFANSSRMRFRAQQMDASIREANDALSGRTDWIANARRFGFSFVAVADYFVAGSTWLARYGKVYEETMNKDLAIAEANIAVERTQGGGNVKDLAQIQDADPLLRPLTMFYSYFSAQYNEFHAILEDAAGGKIKRAAAAYVLIAVIPGLLADAIKLNIPDPDAEDPEKEWAKWLAYHVFMSPFSSVVLVRDIASYVLAKAGGKTFSGYDVTPATGIIDQLGRTIATLGGAMFDEGDELNVYEIVAEVTALGGQAYGLPFARQLNIIASNFAKAEETGVEIGLSDFLVRRRSK